MDVFYLLIDSLILFAKIFRRLLWLIIIVSGLLLLLLFGLLLLFLFLARTFFLNRVFKSKIYGDLIEFFEVTRHRDFDDTWVIL
jgi:hypothetical protein